MGSNTHLLITLKDNLLKAEQFCSPLLTQIRFKFIREHKLITQET